MQPKQFRNLIESARSIVNPIVENGDHECKDCPEHKHDHENEDSGHHEIKHKGKSCKKAHPGMEHEEWEMSQNEEVELDEANQRFGGDTNIPANKKTKAYIESGRAKILINVPSALHPSARFVVAKNPNTGSNQDKVMMFTISDPDRSSRIKMFSFHGTHVSHQKAMDFAKHHKLVARKDAKGRPLYAKESYLNEAGIFNKPRKEYLKLAKAKLGKGKTRTFEFPNNRLASQFAKDISNSGIATTELVDSTKVQVQMLPGNKSVGKSGLAKYLKKNRGKELNESYDISDKNFFK